MKVFNGGSAVTVIEPWINRRRKKRGEREVARKAAITEWRVEVEVEVNVPTRRIGGKYNLQDCLVLLIFIN